MKQLTTQELKNMQQKGDGLALINVLDADQFDREHIPDSTNIPVGDKDFVQRVEEQVGDKSETVVVYCASTECDASPKAARKLEEAGFTDVYDYEGGMKAWKEAGNSVAAGV